MTGQRAHQRQGGGLEFDLLQADCVQVCQSQGPQVYTSGDALGDPHRREENIPETGGDGGLRPLSGNLCCPHMRG